MSSWKILKFPCILWSRMCPSKLYAGQMRADVLSQWLCQIWAVLRGAGHVVSHVTRLTICLLCYSSCAVTARVFSMEKNPWWRNVSGPFPKWEGPVGCKADGGGCHRGRGKVGEMRVHRAVHNKDVAGNFVPSVSSQALLLLGTLHIIVTC